MVPDTLQMLRHLFTLHGQLAPGFDGGEGSLGRRVLYGVSEGSFDGERIRGTVNPGTGDCMSYGGRSFLPADLTVELQDAERRHLTDQAAASGTINRQADLCGDSH